MKSKSKKKLTKTQQSIKFLRSRKYHVIPPTGNHLFARGPVQIKLLGDFETVTTGEGVLIDMNGMFPSMGGVSRVIRDEYRKNVPGVFGSTISRLFRKKKK